MRRHYLVTGRVQGVGFRQFTAQRAQELQLSGWVRNLPDGNVEAEAQGALERLLLFEERLRQGPPLSRVENLTIREIPEEAEHGFAIRR